MKRLAVALFTALFLFSLTVVFRSVTFNSRQIDVPPAKDLSLDSTALLQRLSRAVQFRTVSSLDPKQLPAAEFDGLRDFLAASFPLVHEQLDREIIGDHSLLFKWQGRDRALKPILLMAHMDVVPVDPATEASWRHPPFSGAIAEGYVWGRGTMDDKGSVLAILEAAEHLLRAGFSPQRTIYLAFGHDEEIGGRDGAGKIAERLRRRGIEFEFVIDEGMNIFDRIIAGITAPVALIGVAEKGYLSLRLRVETAGGHTSIPPADSAIALMSRALQRLDAAPFPSHLSGPTRAMFDFLGPEMAWGQKLLLANLWLFDPLVRKQLARSPLTDALIRTTITPTIFNAGVKDNVLPTTATAVVNLRLIPGDTVATAAEYVRRAIDDPKIKVEALPVQMEPSAVSDIAGRSFRLIQRTIREIAPQALVAPALLVAATDSRHYRALSKNIYRFLPITLGPEDTQRYHGIDERISVRDYERLVRFYVRLIENSDRF
ncbi:MAG: M20 family peptidase [Chloroflexota bacterium]